MEQLGVAQPSLPPPNTQQAFENAINMPNAKLNAAAPWQANAGPSPPPASFTPLPNFKAAFTSQTGTREVVRSASGPAPPYVALDLSESPGEPPSPGRPLDVANGLGSPRLRSC